MENAALCEIIKIDKKISENRYARYILYISEKDGYNICSIGVEISEDKAFAEDFCRDRKTAEKFLYLIADEGLEPCHLPDVIYDILPI